MSMNTMTKTRAELGAGLVESQRVRRGHNFYPPKKDRAKTPALYVTDGVAAGQKVVHAHYFVGGCDWWVMEADWTEGRVFGLACLGGDYESAELGYVSLPELEAAAIAQTVHAGNRTARVALLVERDIFWEPVPLAEVDHPAVRAYLSR